MRRFDPPARRPTRAAADQRGVALVLTLLVVVLLSALILDFDFRTRLDVRAAGNFRDDTRAYLLAGSAVDAARAILQEDNPSYDGLDELWATPMPQVPVADGTITVVVTDETGKLDLNTLLTGNGEPDAKRVAVYRRLLEQVVDPDDSDVDELVDTVLDWMDPGLDARPRGAEADYYRGLDPPYVPRDGLLRGFDELDLVKGYTPDVMARLEPHVTAIWTGQDTGHAAGAARHDKININTASVELLTALHPEMTQELAGRIAEDRKDTPFTSVTAATLDKVIGLGTDITQQIAPLLTFRSDYFSVLASGAVGDTRRTVRATIRRGFGGRQPGRRTQVIAWRVE